MPAYSVSAENYNFIGTAMDFWNEAAGRELLVTAPNEGFPIIIDWVDRLTEVEGADPRTAAYSWRRSNECWIELKKKENRLEYDEIAILIHEIGHCIGFSHSPNPHSFMYERINPNQSFTSEIIQLLNE